MTIEIDRKDGTEPESTQKKKKTVTIERKIILGWWIFLVSVAAWMFYLGIIVGRESAPVYFNATQLDSDLMAMVSSPVNPESNDVVLPETTESQELEFFEALKDNKGGSKKIAELEALQSRSKLAAMQPERLPVKASAQSVEGSSPADVSENAHALKSKDGSTGKPGEKATASAKDAKALHDKTDKKKDEKKSENKTADNKKHDAPKNDPKKPEKEKAAEALKKDPKTLPETGKNTQQKQETKIVTATDKSKEQKKQPETKNSISETTAKKVEKPSDSIVSRNPELIKITPAVKEQPHKTVEPVKQEKTKELTVTKTGDAKVLNKPSDQQNSKKEPPKPGKYSIQAGAYTTQNDAAAYARKLSGAGYSTSVVKGKNSDGKEWYRIRVGTYVDKEKAVKMAETIKGAGFPAMVINIPQE